MPIKTFLIIGMLMFFWAAPLHAEQPGDAQSLDQAESYQREISAAADDRERALLYKRLGDWHASREEYGRAGDAFVQAHALAPGAFTKEERLHMAIRISWANRSDDAAAVLRSLLEEYPDYREARVHLAKVLSWSGRLAEAEEEADRVLLDDPRNQDALIVKANVLRWGGDASSSVPLYEQALEGGEQFDARLGLTYAYIDTGDRRGAVENSAMLKPLYPYQEREMKSLDTAMCRVNAWIPGVQLSSYHDSDDNRVNRYGLSFGHRWGAAEAGIRYSLIDAHAPARSITANELAVTTGVRRGRINAGASLGVNRARGGNTKIGSARADARFGWGTIGAVLSRDAMTDTAELIEKRIIRTGQALLLSQALTQRLSLSESFSHASFSDSNHSNDIQLGARYAFLLSSPSVAGGYRFRYWDFERQSNGGYFDPNHFTSHQIYVSLSTEGERWYAAVEPYFGLQAFTRYGEHRGGQGFSGASAVAGWVLRTCAALEATAEGGTYAGGTATGFNYYQVGLGLKMSY